MAPQPSKHGCTRQLVFFLITLLLSSSTAALAAVVPTSYSSPSPAAADRHADVSNEAEPPLASSQVVARTASLYSANTDSEIQQQQQEQVSASIWKMDTERIATVASTMLFCVFTVLWRLQASRSNHEETPAMSMAMHAVIISLGCVALEFVLSHWVFFLVTFVHMFS